MEYRSGSPESFGWLRRPDLDWDDWVAWEKPEGVIVYVPHHLKVLLSQPIPPKETK